MTTGFGQETRASRVLGLAAATCLALVASGAWAVVDDDCADVATAQYTACGAEATDDFYVAQALCLNGPDDDAQEAECLAEARAERAADRLLCTQQRAARNQLCTSLGGGRYAPDFDPAHFDSDFAHLTRPNPWYPLRIGNHWEFAGSGEAVSIDVLDATKLVEGSGDSILIVQSAVAMFAPRYSRHGQEGAEFLERSPRVV